MTIYQRIIRAAKRGHGVRLSYDDCFALSLDDAISTRATNDDLNDQGISDEEIDGGFGRINKQCSMTHEKETSVRNAERRDSYPKDGE